MRLLCNGVALDLELGATMAFKKVNPLFAFDKIACERTQSFKLPKTPTNDRVLALARVTAYDGRGMRRRFSAEYQDGVVVKRGYLYVDKWDGKSYNAIFVTGELIGLQSIKEAGAIRDFLVTDKRTKWGDPISASDAYEDAPTWQSVEYMQTYAGGVPFPSYRLTAIMNECFDQLGVPRPVYPSASITQSHIRVIPESVKGIDAKLRLTSVPRANEYGTQPYINEVLNFPRQYFDETFFVVKNMMEGRCAYFDGYDQQDRPVAVRYLEVEEGAEGTNERRMWGYRARYDCDISFDNNVPDLALFRLDIVSHSEDIGQLWQSQAPEWSWFVGSRLAGGNALTTSYSRLGDVLTYDLVRPVGEPIRGRSFHLNAGERFALIDLNDLVSEQAYQWTAGATRTARFDFQYDGKDYFEDGQKAYDVLMNISTVKPEVGDDVLLQANLPSFSLIDACKIWAGMSGTVLNYDDTEGVIFDGLARPDTWGTVDITGKVLEVTKVSRTFADYARHNTISFDSADETYGYERLEVDYEVDNDNIQEARQLYQVPLSEGGMASDVAENPTLTPVLVRNTDEQETSKATISSAFDGDEYLGRVVLKKNDFIARLCEQSTMVEVRVRMSAYEHSLITPKTKILLDGTLYVWTEADWSKDVVRLLLAKM